MRKNLLRAALGAVAMTVASNASAAVNVTVTPISEEAYQMRKAVSVSTADVIVQEDFEAFSQGTPENPDWDHKLCSHYESELIRPSMTHGAQWKGHNVYMAGGCAALRNFDPQDVAYINTPAMDYSGTVTVSFLVKALPTTWEQEDENGEMQTWYFSSSTVMARICTDDYNEKFDFGSDTKLEDGTNFFMLPFYPEHGWCEVKIEFDNYSSYNDAFFQIASAGHLLVDDVRVTQSVNKFIGAPMFQGFTAATEDSFTVSFTPVRRASSYYMYLYELTGYDDEGNPEYKTVIPIENFFSEEDKAAIEGMGMTLVEYLEYMAEQMGITYDDLLASMIYDKPYNNLGNVREDGSPLYTFTYTGLDPEKQYYFDIRSHYYKTFSPENIRPVNVIGSPENLAATDVSEDGFVANWKGIYKAEGYTVDLYGVNECQEDEDNFVIFQEDFDATEHLTDATDINNPEATGPASDIVFDDLTSTPGWEFGNDDYILLVKGKAGLGVDDYGCYRLTSPAMFVGNADKAIISLCVESPISDYEIRIRFAGQVYNMPVEGNKIEGEIELPTFGLQETDFAISGPDEAPIFIDYITVMQPLKKGDLTYIWLGREETDVTTTSFAFDGLDPEEFDMYAFCAGAWMGSGRNKLSSLDGGRMLVDLKSGESKPVDVDEIEIAGNVEEVERYTLDGRKVSAPVPGVNIVRYSDGSVRKVMVK